LLATAEDTNRRHREIAVSFARHALRSLASPGSVETQCGLLAGFNAERLFRHVERPADGYADERVGNGEIRGPRHLGDKSRKVAAGDVLVMPPGIPHQTVVEPGKSFFVLIVKVERK
jgi:hypothetical protein